MSIEVPPPPPFEVTPELQEQLAALTRQAMAQLEALVAALAAAGAQLPPPPPPPDTIIPIVAEPPPEILVGDLELSTLALEPPILITGPIEKGEGWEWSRPMPLAVELSRVMPVDLPVVAVEIAAVAQPAGFAPGEVIDLSGFWLDLDRNQGGGEGGMF
jgi:hypothetical protein